MKIIHIDPSKSGLSSEDLCMLQALYSRSSASVNDHLEKVKQTGSGKFMEQYYVGYGHESIGDCGTLTFFFEGVSILAAKAIQDHPLYNGQESSTRYIDWSTQPFYNPFIGDIILDEWLNRLRFFYVEAKEKQVAYLKTQYPIKEGEKEAVYERAINARCFDILRGFLPSGAVTQLSWTGPFSLFHRRLPWLLNHPLPEVQQIGAELLDQLSNMYPTSFKHKDYYSRPELVPSRDHYYAPNDLSFSATLDSPYIHVDASNSGIIEKLGSYNSRTGFSPIDNYRLGNITLNGLIDYGSFRDLQRHRNGINIMPRVTASHGFHEWYIDQLAPELKADAAFIIANAKFIDAYVSKSASSETAQYFIPMGFLVPYRLNWTWNQLLYVMRLRSTKFIHATLRDQVHAWDLTLRNVFNITLPEGLVDKTPGDFDIKRGEQTITEKATTYDRKI